MIYQPDIKTMQRAHAGHKRIDPTLNYFQHALAELERRLAQLAESERALRSSEARYRALYDNNPAMCFTVDAAGMVLSVNAFGAQRLGFLPHELIGRSVLETMVEEDRAAVGKALSECLTHIGRPRTWEFRTRRKDGTCLWVRETIRAVAEPDGALVLLIVCEDASALKSSEAEAREATARMHLALTSSNVAIFNWDIAGGTIYLSERWSEMLGGTPGETMTTAQALGLVIHPQDAAGYRARLYRAIKGETPAFEYEFRARAHNNTWRWIITQGKVVDRDADGRAVRMVGTNADITALKEAEEHARRHARDFEVLYDLTRDLALHQDFATLLQSVMDRARRLLGAAAGSIWFYDPLRNDLALALASNLDLEVGARMEMGEGLVGRVARARHALIVEDYCNWPERPQRFSDVNGHGALAVPLASRGTLIGVLCLWDAEPGPCRYSDNDARLLSMLAGPAAIAIERMHAEEELRRSEARFRSLTELSSDWYWEQDAALRFTQLSGGMLEQTGFDPRQDIGLTPWELGGVELCEPSWPELRATLEQRLPFRDALYRRRNVGGDLHYHSVSGEPVFGEGGDFKGYRGIGRDVTERFKAEQRIHRLAHYDALSGLPNRVLFNQRLQQALVRALRFDRSLAVLSLDLDRFKNINDSFGHSAGDQVLREVAERLTRITNASDTVARLGGDEFVVLVESCGGASEVSALARTLLGAVGRPYVIADQECHMTASMGISIFPQDSKDAQALLRDADTAMYRAKERGKNSFQFYSAQMNAQAFERLNMESKLRRALDRDEFELHYQPSIELATGRIISVEALVRWPQEDGTYIEPAVFIPVAEDSGLIEQLGQWVLHAACIQAKTWRARGLPPIRVAVNLSARQFLQEDLLANLALTIDETGIEPALLEFEITESLMFSNPEQAAAILHALKLMGVRLALDDFGTGYSSLSYLKRFPFDRVKIDRSFIRDLPRDQDDAAITRAVVAMSHSLRMSVTAEGVEEEAQLAFLRACGCDAAQGNYFSPAVSAERFDALFGRDLLTRPLLRLTEMRVR